MSTFALAGNRYVCPNLTPANVGSGGGLLLKVSRGGEFIFLNLGPQLSSLKIHQYERVNENGEATQVNTLVSPGTATGYTGGVQYRAIFEPPVIIAGLNIHDGAIADNRLLVFVEKAVQPTVGLLIDPIDYRFSLCAADDGHLVEDADVKSLVSTFSKNLREVLNSFDRSVVQPEADPRTYLAQNDIQREWPLLSADQKEIIVGLSLASLAGTAAAVRSPIVRAAIIKMAKEINERVAKRVTTVETANALRTLGQRLSVVAGSTAERAAVRVVPSLLRESLSVAGKFSGLVGLVFSGDPATEDQGGIGYGYFFTVKGVGTIAGFSDHNFDYFLNSSEMFGPWVNEVAENLRDYRR